MLWIGKMYLSTLFENINAIILSSILDIILPPKDFNLIRCLLYFSFCESLFVVVKYFVSPSSLSSEYLYLYIYPDTF